MWPNFGLSVSGHFVIKNPTYKKRDNVYVFIAFQQQTNYKTHKLHQILKTFS